VCCKANGQHVPAELVDHIVPHKGDYALMWDEANWQSLCGWCHGHVKSVLERAWLTGRLAVEKLRLDRVTSHWKPRRTL
jgi:5-methylcytosine-specific restriction protein A